MERRSKSSGGKQKGNKCWALPRDTEQLVSAIRSSQCSSISLLVDKLIEVIFDRDDQRVELAKIKPLDLPEEYTGVLASYIGRWKETLDRLNTPSFHVSNFRAKSKSRFVVGLGAAHVQEVSITLHHVWGFPIIPGSALKGLTRAYAELILKKTETNAELLSSIFGGQESRGKVVFFDAVPLSDSVIPRLDVMTPHYSEYFKALKPPADYLDPVPVHFYVVENAEFLFSLGSVDEALLEKAARWLKDALAKMGVGAKTTAGYGYFEPL